MLDRFEKVFYSKATHKTNLGDSHYAGFVLWGY